VYVRGTDDVSVRMVCLAQLNFTSKAVFLENSFMSNFLEEAGLYLEKVFGKIASQTIYYIHS